MKEVSPHPSVVVCTLLIALLCASPALSGNARQALEADGFVEITDVIPDIVLDIKYATPDNFTKEIIYSCVRCYLRKDVALRLARVQAALKEEGLGLKVFDGYRPFWVQEQFWELVPDERYVAKPKMENGLIVIGSRHNRGAAVDVTLVDSKGKELEMPTGYDDFSPKAKADYPGGTETSRANRDLLINAMGKQGFTVYPTEWWHFDAPAWDQFDMINLPICDK